MTQLAIPVEITASDVAREKSLGGAIELCYKAAGYEGKEVEHDLKLDKAQLSRWKTGGEGVVWPKFVALMDYCGNDAPLLWMLHDRGYDLHSLRRRETETERRLRLAEEEIENLKKEREVERRLFRELRAPA